MSLPKTFANEDSYFKAVVDFLHDYSWVYSEANTSCLKALEFMPQDFKDYFLGLSNEYLNTFPFVHEPLEDCPEKVLSFRQQIANMTPQQTTASRASVPSCASQAARKCSNQNRKIGLKKKHEVEQLAGKIHEHCAETKTQLIIDLGSGLGYLSESLLKLNDNYLMVCLEADEKTVESARQRCQKLLPQEALKSIKYKKEFIRADANSRARIERYASELIQSHGLSTGLRTAMIGLHACADLSISAMILFLTMPQVRSLHIMPCCYHKLALRDGESNESTTSSPFVNFPLSNGLLKAMSASSAAAVGCFNRPFMRLACQETNSRWRIDSDAHAEHGRQMYLRALANALCDIDERVKVLAKTSHEEQDTFNDLRQRYTLYSQQTGKPLNWTLVHEARFTQIGESYSNGRGACLAEALCCLQTSMQKLCENLVLYDRLCYLKDMAAGQHLQVEALYEKLFDEQVSPRCHVLIAKKL